MAENTDAKPDERFALGLLINHLTSCGESGFQCKCNANDPPDLIITWKHGERWGVEVARAYQQVEQIGRAEVVSSESVGAFLRAFGSELARETEGKRLRDYALYLEGPGPFSSWKRSVPRQQWKEKTKASILKHVASGDSGALSFPGGRLRPSEPGERWTVLVGQGAAEMDSAITELLRIVLKDKTDGLRRWKATFSQGWLLLLNCYPLADDAAEVEGTLRRLIRENAESPRFDGVFWSGYPDRMLIPISLSESP